MKITTFITAWVLSYSLISADTTVADTENTATEGKKEAVTASENISALTKAYNDKNAAFMKKLRAEKDRKKMMEMYRSERPDPAPVVASILDIAEKNPKEEGVEKGLEWSVRYANVQQADKITDLLLTHYPDSKALGTTAQRYARMFKGGEEGLRKIIAQAKSEKVRQGASYYLATKLMRNEATKADGLALLKKLESTPGIEKSNPRLLAQVKGQITVIEKLSIGCTAPDIVGTDHDDKEFKLSDYRGKVVLIDFWGIW